MQQVEHQTKRQLTVLQDGAPLAVRPSFAQQEEIDTFDEFVQRFRRKQISEQEFQRFRLQHGVYGQRQQGEQMFRIKIPWGGLTAEQLDVLADLAQRTPRKIGHVTTRQNIQFHFLKLAEAPEFMQALEKVGITTREACGNTVRNVTAGACSGVCPSEVFDVTPYAEAVARYLLRNPINQNLPRKFKIAFSGCPDDEGITAIHDIGGRAVLHQDNGVSHRGFKVMVAGGLGPVPHQAQLLEEFTPADELLATVGAIVRVFDRFGNRENRSRARLKFVMAEFGLEKFRAQVFKERTSLKVTMGGKIPPIVVREEGPPSRDRSLNFTPDLLDPAYQLWRRSNVRPQKQPGYVMVTVRLELGDFTPLQLRVLAFCAREFGDGTVRTTNQQNFLLRWIPDGALAALYRVLGRVDLARSGGDRLIDVTACPGADTCQLGITSSRGLAVAIARMIEEKHPDLANEVGGRIKISGCPNSCGQHHIATIGFYGGSRKFGGRQAPTYQMLLGGQWGDGSARHGKPTLRVPSKNIPGAIDRILDTYKAHRSSSETLQAFLDRFGFDQVAALLAGFTELPTYDEAPDGFQDWGEEEIFQVKTGAGECAV
ncbi:MAG TPA: nitrite/sulfite reductase [Nitrospirales bacterium]|nr:nitrite/sulfite reductase [Nitrospirales bacterium]